MDHIHSTLNASINDAIKQMTVEAWAAEGKALLLARLGQALTRQGYDLRAYLKGRRLAVAIEEEIGDSVQILTSPTDPLVRAVISKEVKLDANLGIYFGRAPEKVASTPVEKIRFNHKLWIAFSRPLPSDAERFFNVGSEMAFHDVPVGSACAGIAIPRDKIISSAVVAKDERERLIEQNIHWWIREHGISPLAVKAEVGEKRPTNEPANSIFDLIIQSLDAAELRRITMPLDVVLKLQGKLSRSK